MAMMIPHFIIGGAPRSGTTWLYQVLERHPQIYMAKPVRPEPKFFLMDDLYRRGFSYYLETWFSDLPENVKVGEKSTNYLENAHVAERIYRHIPHVKLIFLLREPGQRAFSNYLWSRMNGLETEDFRTALRLEKERSKNLPENLRYARPFDYLYRGFYAKHLAAYFKFFSKENILCLKTEDISDRPQVLIQRVHTFLEISFRSHDVDNVGIVNRAEGSGEEMIAPDTRAMLNEIYAKHNEELSKLLGPDFEPWQV